MTLKKIELTPAESKCFEVLNDEHKKFMGLYDSEYSGVCSIWKILSDNDHLAYFEHLNSDGECNTNNMDFDEIECPTNYSLLDGEGTHAEHDQCFIKYRKLQEQAMTEPKQFSDGDTITVNGKQMKIVNGQLQLVKPEGYVSVEEAFPYIKIGTKVSYIKYGVDTIEGINDYYGGVIKLSNKIVLNESDKVRLED